MKDIKTLICSDKKKTATILGAGTAAVLMSIGGLIFLSTKVKK
ncbi:hypothetical protein [Clostridium sp.]|nr:hypothetical protein [Clostridium sp.]MDY6012960.1 hypothetical protein [Clostridium sp.]